MAAPLPSPFDRRSQDSMEETLRERAEPVAAVQAELHPVRRWLLMVILLLGLLFSTLDTSIVSTSLVSIATEFEDILNAPWIVLSYLLTYMGRYCRFAIGFSKMSDIYGRRALLLTAWVFFVAFSIGCGRAQNMTQLIISRAFQGIGASGLYSLTQIGMIEIGPADDRPALVGAMIGMTLAVSFVLGPILGGVISHFGNWRWIFYINIPFGGVAIILMLTMWPPRTDDQLTSWKKKLISIDFVGNLLLLAGSILLIFALQQAGSFIYAWNSPAVVASLVISGLSWMLFWAWEIALGMHWFPNIQPIFPIRLIQQRVYSGALLTTLLTGFSYITLVVIIPERFQMVNGDDALWAGVHLLPLLGACALGSFLAGAASSRRNLTAETLIAACVLQVVGTALLARLRGGDDGDAPGRYAYEAVFGLGVGLSLGAATMLVAVQARHGDLAAAQGGVAQARVFGGALGLSVCAALLNARVRGALGPHLPPGQLEQLFGSPAAVAQMASKQGELAALVRSVYADAFARAVDLLLYVGIAAFFFSLLAWERAPASLRDTIGRHKAPDGPRPRRGRDRSDVELDDVASLRTGQTIR